MIIENTVALVTGAASGLGLATTERLIGSGAKVTMCDLNNESGADIADQLGPNALFVKTDVTQESDVLKAIDQTISNFGPLTAACNFAGIAPSSKLAGSRGAHDFELFQKVISVNLFGTFNVMRLCAQSMLEKTPVDENDQRGVLVNTASIAAFDGQIGQCAYAASKAAIAGMTLPAARDLGLNGIRCLTIAPGIIHTPLFDSLPPDAVQALSSQPINPKRLGKPGEVAKLVTSMIENDYLNGETIRIDGALRMPPK